MQRAEQLRRFETPMVLACAAVDVEVKPGRVGPEAGEEAVQAARPRRPLLAEPDPRDLCRAVEAIVAAVFDDDLEAPRRAQAPDRRGPKTLTMPR